MTQLLQRAIEEVEKLPSADQDGVAARILAELEDEELWTRQFAATSPEQWARMAEAVRRERESGETMPLEEALPADISER